MNAPLEFFSLISANPLKQGSILKSPVSSSTTRFAIECARQLSHLARRIPPVARQVSLELARAAQDDPRGALRCAALRALMALTRHEFVTVPIVEMIKRIMSREQTQVTELIYCAKLVNRASEQNTLDSGVFRTLIELMNGLIVEHESLHLRIELLHSIARLLARHDEMDEWKLENMNMLAITLNEFDSDDERLERGVILNTAKITLSEMARLDPVMVNEVYQIIAKHCLRAGVNQRKLELLCYIAWTQIDCLTDGLDHYAVLKCMAQSPKCSEKEILAALNLTLIQSHSDSIEAADQLLACLRQSPHYTAKTLFYVSRMAVRYARYTIGERVFTLLRDETKGSLSFHFTCFIECMSRFASVENQIGRINPTNDDNSALIKQLNEAALVFDEISLEMLNHCAQIWIDCRSVLFRTCSIFLLTSSCTPQAYLADELRQSADKISRLLLKNRATSDICRQRIIYLQQLLNCVAIIFEHGSSNLLVKPGNIAHFSAELLKHNDTAFDECRQFLSVKNFHQAVLSLITIPVPPPYLFFNETKEELVKLEITPKPSTTQPNLTRVSFAVKLILLILCHIDGFKHCVCRRRHRPSRHG